MENKKIVFFRVAWMKDYCGYTSEDVAINGGTYVDEHNGNCCELSNFLAYNLKCYGFVQNGQSDSINLDKINGATTKVDALDGVTVVWVATKPDKSGMTIVGWYEGATVFRNYHAIYDINLHNYNIDSLNYCCSTDLDKAFLIAPEERDFKVPSAIIDGAGNGLGRSNVWYAESEFAKKVFIPQVLAYLEKAKEENKTILLYNELTNEDFAFIPEDEDKTVEELLTAIKNPESYDYDMPTGLALSNLALKKEKSFRTWAARANFLSLHMEYDAGIKCFKEALKFNPNDFDSMMGLFYDLNITRRNDEAIELGEKLHENHADLCHPAFYMDMGILLANKGNFDRAWMYHKFMKEFGHEDANVRAIDLYDFIKAAEA